MKLIFAGTPENAALGLELAAKHHEVVLVITREDAELGRKRILTPSAVAQKAEQLGLPVLKANRIKAEQIDAIKSAGADLALVIAYGSLIPQPALDELRWWNIHFSLLPLWRGASPLQQSIRTGGLGAGVTLFELDSGMDTGAIVAQLPIELGENETTGEALTRFTKAGIELFQTASATDIPPEPQKGVPSMAPKITRADARLDLEQSAIEVHRAVMAFNPEPMAWVEHKGNPIRIISTKSLSEKNSAEADRSVGRVTRVEDRVTLECGNGSLLELAMVQPAGKQPMSAADWLRGLDGEVQLA
jgi:methionyl-tRNA formyltransferase